MIELKSGLTAEMLAEKDRGCAVDPVLPAAWAVELDLLIELDRICRKHKIPYFLDAGTLLGAVRHGGFIPWDDDVDVAMKREDYDHFCRIAPSEFSHPYFFQDHHTDLEYPSYHAKIRNSETTAIPYTEIKRGRCKHWYNQGIYIDVFPLDGVPADREERACFVQELRRIKGQKRRLLNERCIYFRDRLTRFTEFRDYVLGLPRRAFEKFTGINPLARVDREYDQLIRTYNGKSDWLESLTIAAKRGGPVYTVSAQSYEGSEELSFEGFRFPAPRNSDRVLTEMFGNWRVPIRGTSLHKTLLIDADRPYTEYLKNGVRDSDLLRMSQHQLEMNND